MPPQHSAGSDQEPDENYLLLLRPLKTGRKPPNLLKEITSLVNANFSTRLTPAPPEWIASSDTVLPKEQLRSEIEAIARQTPPPSQNKARQAPATTSVADDQEAREAVCRQLQQMKAKGYVIRTH